MTVFCEINRCKYNIHKNLTLDVPDEQNIIIQICNRTHMVIEEKGLVNGNVHICTDYELQEEDGDNS